MVYVISYVHGYMDDNVNEILERDGHMSKDNEDNVEPDCASKGKGWVDFTPTPKRRRKRQRYSRLNQWRRV